MAKALDVIEAAGLPRRVVIDASHGNSRKDHRRQPSVALTVAEQVADGERAIAGVMLESFLIAGRQEPGDPAGLVYGQSVTDSCMDFPITEALLKIITLPLGILTFGLFFLVINAVVLKFASDFVPGFDVLTWKAALLGALALAVLHMLIGFLFPKRRPRQDWARN